MNWKLSEHAKRRLEDRYGILYEQKKAHDMIIDYLETGNYIVVSVPKNQFRVIHIRTNTRTIALVIDHNTKTVITATPVVFIEDEQAIMQNEILIYKQCKRLENEVTRLTGENADIILQAEIMYKKTIYRYLKNRMIIQNMRKKIYKKILSILFRKDSRETRGKK